MTVKLGLVGTGTVGGGCIDILKNHREDFKRHYGIDVELVRVCSRNPSRLSRTAWRTSSRRITRTS